MITLSPQDFSAIVLSLKVATSATLLALPFGFGVAYLLAIKKIRGKVFIEGIVNLPLVLPPVVIGYLLMLLLGKSGFIGSFLDKIGITLMFSLKGAVIASTVVGFPLLVRSIRTGLEAIDLNYLSVARTLGAGWFDTVWSIMIPLSARAILAGMTLMFARSLGEFGATIILAGNIPGITQTIPLAIFQYTSMPGGDSMALGLCVVSIILSYLVLMTGELVSRYLARG
ncbi:MAG: molybdate ABC transporter permease subunit [Desulfobulbaceae bacterium]|nr:MAG: molybdate ABC transporter permease subunit [Desulfobulbaceae bacterium]